MRCGSEFDVAPTGGVCAWRFQATSLHLAIKQCPSQVLALVRLEVSLCDISTSKRWHRPRTLALQATARAVHVCTPDMASTRPIAGVARCIRPGAQSGSQALREAPLLLSVCRTLMAEATRSITSLRPDSPRSIQPCIEARESTRAYYRLLYI